MPQQVPELRSRRWLPLTQTGRWRFAGQAGPSDRAIGALAQEVRAIGEGHGILLPIVEPGATVAQLARPLAFRLTPAAAGLLRDAQHRTTA